VYVNYPKIGSMLTATKPGDIVKYRFCRRDKIFEADSRMGSVEKVNKYVFVPKKEATSYQMSLLTAWLKNL
jgi:hypothetical protein